LPLSKWLFLAFFDAFGRKFACFKAHSDDISANGKTKCRLISLSKLLVFIVRERREIFCKMVKRNFGFVSNRLAGFAQVRGLTDSGAEAICVVGGGSGGIRLFRLCVLEIALLQPNRGCRGTGVVQSIVVDVVELDYGAVGPLCGMSIEGDGVSDFLCACGEAERGRARQVIGRGEQNVGDVCGGVGSIVIEPPDSETRTALSGLEGRVGRRFSHGSASRKHDYRRERRCDCRTVAIAWRMQVDGYGPSTDQAEVLLLRLGLRRGSYRQRGSEDDEGGACAESAACCFGEHGGDLLWE
jgi:hypothetical protein